MLQCVTVSRSVVSSVYGCRLVSIVDVVHTEYFICLCLAQPV
jgi:hypothetical protein